MIIEMFRSAEEADGIEPSTSSLSKKRKERDGAGARSGGARLDGSLCEGVLGAWAGGVAARTTIDERGTVRVSSREMEGRQLSRRERPQT